MGNKYHILVFILCFCFNFLIGILNSSSIFELFSTRKNIIAIVIYTLLLMSICYTFLWSYYLSKKIMIKNNKAEKD